MTRNCWHSLCSWKLEAIDIDWLCLVVAAQPYSISYHPQAERPGEGEGSHQRHRCGLTILTVGCQRIDCVCLEKSKRGFARSLTTRKVVVEVLSMADGRVSRRVAERKKFVLGPEVEVEFAGRFSQCTASSGPADGEVVASVHRAGATGANTALKLGVHVIRLIRNSHVGPTQGSRQGSRRAPHCGVTGEVAAPMASYSWIGASDNEDIYAVHSNYSLLV